MSYDNAKTLSGRNGSLMDGKIPMIDLDKHSEVYKKTKLWDKRNETPKKNDLSTFADVDKRLASEFVHRYMRPRVKNPFALNQEEEKEK